VTRVSRVHDIVQKQGRTGPLCFVTIRHVLSVGAHEVAVERQDIVYRGPDTAPIASPAPGPAAEWSKAVVPSEPLLFRYSALTFNAHRIHYDRRFCQEVEQYPGLVVHGPLQATLLLHFATDLKHGEPPRHFAFRSSAPLFDGDPFLVCATATETGLQLWTENAASAPAMRAEASW
jgi:3-methylfumaryl-CoA hydratase